MKLTKKQQNLVVEKLNKIKPKCQVCGSENLTVNNNIFELREFNGGSLIIGGQSTLFPVVLLTCAVCSHILSFSAIMLGVLTQNEETKNEQQSEKSTS